MDKILKRLPPAIGDIEIIAVSAERQKLLEEVVRAADTEYQYITVQKDPEGGAEAYQDIVDSVKALRAFDEKHGIRKGGTGEGLGDV